MNRTDQLVAAIQAKYRTPGAALRALGFNAQKISEIIQEQQTMPKLAFDEIVGRDRSGRALPHPAALAMDALPRRPARDDAPNAEAALEEIEQIFAELPDDEAAALADELEQRLDDTGPAADQSFRRGRRARDSSDPANQFRSASTGSKLDGVGVPDPHAQDRRRARDRRVAADSAGLPTFEQLFPGAAARLRS